MLSANDMARALGISSTAVCRYMRDNGLKISKKRMNALRKEKLRGRTKLTAAQQQVIREQYLKVPSKTLANQLGVSDTCLRTYLRNNSLVIPQKIVEARKRESRFQRGINPWNSGRVGIRVSKKSEFKKGDLPANTLTDGAITIRTHTNYKKGGVYQNKYIRVSLGKWVPLHRHVWEQAHGPIPRSHIIAFKDGDPMNCDLDNLSMISKAENAARNRNGAKASIAMRANFEEGNISDRRAASYLAVGDRELQQKLIKEAPALIQMKKKLIEIKNQRHEEYTT